MVKSLGGMPDMGHQPRRSLESGNAEQLFGRLRPAQVPAHCVTMSSDGVPRCIRCVLPEALLHQRQCRPAGTCSHAVWDLGKGLFCVWCGAYTFMQVRQLGGTCKGRPADAAARWCFQCMIEGRHPAAGAYLAVPRLMEPALDCFHLILGQG